MKKILIVEDDQSIHDFIKELLIEENYQVIDAFSGTEAIYMIQKESPDLILLDLMLPGLNGEEIIKKVREIPIIVISAKISMKDKVENLLNGAVDYVTKPFCNEELLARIKVHLRNSKKINQELTYKELMLLNDHHTLLVRENKIKLTKTEYAILKQLLLNQNQVISKSELLELITRDTEDCDENSLKVHISHLNKKISVYSNQKYIESVWGIGYKLSD